MIMGSAAVVAVYSAGFFHTAAAAAKVAAEEQGRSDARGRGADRESVRPSAVSELPGATATAASLPVRPPAALPPAAVPATLQTPTPAPLAAPIAATSPMTPVPAPASPSPAAPSVAALPVAAPAVPASLPNPVPATPVPVAAVPATPVPAVPQAVATATLAPAAAPAVTKKYKDGAYFGWGRCRHGDLKVTLELKDDKIISAEITECYTRYSKNVISRLPKQIVDRQNPDKIDRISGASESSDAYYYAVLEALKAAKL